jgi:hypothetical protein
VDDSVDQNTRSMPRAQPAAQIPIQQITRSILVVRGHRVILDRDLAAIYGVETKVLNHAVKRNIQRFPEDFLLRLNPLEAAVARSQILTLKSARGQNQKCLPYAFTGHGAIQAANILGSPRAIQFSIYLMRASVEMRELIGSHQRLIEPDTRILELLESCDQPVAEILGTLRELMIPDAPISDQPP